MIRTPLAALAAACCLGLAVPPALAHDTGGHAGAHAHDAASAHACDEIAIGDIVISGPFSRATLPNAPVAGGFLTLANTGAEDDRLVAASAPVARETQIHEMAMAGDVMKMRQLPEGIPLPAGETVVLQPGGLHLMFMGLEAALVEGETVPVTLLFEKAGEITIDMPVAAAAADAPATGHAGH